MSRDWAHLADVLAAARLAHSYVQGVALAAFETDRMRQDAVVRELEIMGEATKRLSEGFRAAHADVPWRQIAGMRDVLIHGYDEVDVAAVWRVAAEELPDVIRNLAPLAPPADGGG